ncbi:hypothetical protein TNCV_674501 [Trichonephila clavipes]|nr:hypothetical protein TNCV_674501 [Trichonephila clavipes]
MKKSSVEFISRSPTPSPMERNHRRFSFGLYGRTAADSVQSGWPIVAAKAKLSSRAGAANQNKNSWTLEQRERERSDSSRLMAVGILKFPGVLNLSIESVGIERCDPPRAVMYTSGHSALCRCWICDTLGMCHSLLW